MSPQCQDYVYFEPDQVPLFAGKSYCNFLWPVTSLLSVPLSFPLLLSRLQYSRPIFRSLWSIRGCWLSSTMCFSRMPGFMLSCVSKQRSISHAPCASGTCRERKCRGCQKQQWSYVVIWWEEWWNNNAFEHAMNQLLSWGICAEDPQDHTCIHGCNPWVRVWAMHTR